MIEIYVGLPGAGKSLRTAEILLQLLHRNKKYFHKMVNDHKREMLRAAKAGDEQLYAALEESFPVQRVVYSNISIHPEIEKQFAGYIKYWSDPFQLVKLRDCDVIWDEIATHLDSTQWQMVPLELKRWLQQHRKMGIDIYGNTQDFPMIDISMRRLVSRVFLMKKIIGSRDKSATRPEVKNPWGVIVMREVDPSCFTSDKTDYKFVSTTFTWITKTLCNVFDTRQEITAGKYPPLRHIERECQDENCTFHKVLHV